MKKVIDARKLDCPKPVINTKKALEAGGFDKLEILVDNIAARDNVSSLLRKMNLEIARVVEAKGDYTIYVDVMNGESEEKDKKIESPGGITLFIGSDAIGHGSDELGTKLMKAFTYTLNELDNQPQRLLFMNSGVKLCITGSDSLNNIIKLAECGVDILVCGTCLDYFGITDMLRVGKISNMYDIAGHLLDDEKVVKV
jgi:selenium metabolism protein YedF